MTNKKYIFFFIFFILSLNTLFATDDDSYQEPFDYKKENFDKNHTMYSMYYQDNHYPQYYRNLAQSLSVNTKVFKSFLYNTVNSNTAGFRKSRVSARKYGDEIVAEQFYDWSKERPVNTARPLDIYVSGKTSFFTLVLPNREQIYTSDGRFGINAKGELISIAHEIAVLGEDGPIILPGEDVNINHKGEIYFYGEFIDRLKITTFSTTDGLWSYEGSLFYVYNPDKTEIIENNNYDISQGFFEASNEVPGIYSGTDAQRPYMRHIFEGTAKKKL